MCTITFSHERICPNEPMTKSTFFSSHPAKAATPLKRLLSAIPETSYSCEPTRGSFQLHHSLHGFGHFTTFFFVEIPSAKVTHVCPELSPHFPKLANATLCSMWHCRLYLCVASVSSDTCWTSWKRSRMSFCAMEGGSVKSQACDTEATAM